MDGGGMDGGSVTGGATQGPLRVLVVEDNDAVRGLVVTALVQDGCSVEQASGAVEARLRISENQPQVVVLDLGLPDANGLDLLRELVGGGTPVVVLTGRGDEVDRVVGLELGAEEYMVKPFFPKELAARVRRAAGGARPTSSRRLQVGELVIDRDSREVVVSGKPVPLADREFDLLAYLVASPRRVFSRDELLRDIWKSEPELTSSKTITEHVHRLRKKLENDPARPRLIVTVGRAGSRFDPRPDG